MEYLINIIIIFVIFASILKRIREIGETRGNLDKPAPPGQRTVTKPVPGPAPPLAQRPLQPESAQPPAVRMEQATPASETPSVRDMMESVLDEVFHEPEIPQLKPLYDTSYSEDIWDHSQQDIEARIRESQEAYRKSLDAVVPAVSVRKPVRPVGVRGLRFTGDALVNGIIMSEILGPPKSLRGENW